MFLIDPIRNFYGRFERPISSLSLLTILTLGYFTRVTAFLLALHMLDITFTVGYSGVGVRDFVFSTQSV